MPLHGAKKEEEIKNRNLIINYSSFIRENEADITKRPR
jgi:hypothetical protein